MAIGYACLTVGVPGTGFRTCRKDAATPEVLRELIRHNLTSLDRILDYNDARDIRLFRISSDIIPFGSHPVNRLRWWEEFADELGALGAKAADRGLRLSMHPGQYTVLNSPNPDVVERAVADLAYHNRFLDAMGLDGSNKLILHIGGAYGDKRSALRRFAENYAGLDDGIRRRLVIENDDKLFTIGEVMTIGTECGIPVVFDNLHNAVNPEDDTPEIRWIERAGKTWREADGRQKIHYSQQAAAKKAGSHSATIDVAEFSRFYCELGAVKPDIMLEVKDKNLSAVKCIYTVHRTGIGALEREWARYKYLVLERSPRIYTAIRELLKDKSGYPVTQFYDLIDRALSEDPEPGHAINAAQHVWGYFKDSADDTVRRKFERALSKIRAGGSAKPAKRVLLKLVKESGQAYLRDSLYFAEIL